jgi:hypothetical protein
VKDARTPAVVTVAAKVESPMVFASAGATLTERERLYASGARKRDNRVPAVRDPRPRSRLYGR